MYGIFVNGQRPKTKKAVKEAVANRASVPVKLQNTSMFGGYDGPLGYAPAGDYVFVGPDPYSKRNWFGTITVKSDGSVTVK